MAELAQAYLRMETTNVEDRDLRAYIWPVRKEIAVATREIFGPGIKIRIELRRGSVVGWITAIGSLGILLAHYPQLKTGINEAASDASRMGARVIKIFAKQFKLSKEQMYTQKRLQTPGRIQRLLRRMQYLEKIFTDMTEEDKQHEAAALGRLYDKITEDVDDHKTLVALDEELAAYPVWSEFTSHEAFQIPEGQDQEALVSLKEIVEESESREDRVVQEFLADEEIGELSLSEDEHESDSEREQHIRISHE